MTFRLAQLARLTLSVVPVSVGVAIINVVVVAVVVITDPLAVGPA